MRRGSFHRWAARNAGWAAFVFMLGCPHDDPLYIAVWYPAGCSVSALAAWAILARLARW